jgi:hypothetical protein
MENVRLHLFVPLQEEGAKNMQSKESKHENVSLPLSSTIAGRTAQMVGNNGTHEQDPGQALPGRPSPG